MQWVELWHAYCDHEENSVEPVDQLAALNTPPKCTKSTSFFKLLYLNPNALPMGAEYEPVNIRVCRNEQKSFKGFHLSGIFLPIFT